MSDPVLDPFLHRQFEEAAELARNSDVLELLALDEPGRAPSRYIAKFQCKSVLRDAQGSIRVAPGEFHVGFWLPPDYVRRPPDPGRLATWLSPPNIMHPNISPPAICLGRITPGTRLIDLLYQTYELITFVKYSTHDYLNPDAANWARRNQHLLPVDRRPLKRRKQALRVTKEDNPR